jgi:hypothetical protein
MTFNTQDYWPSPAPGDAQFNVVGDRTLKYWLDPTYPGVVRMDEFMGADRVLNDSWLYAFTSQGILEVADVYPDGRVTRMTPGKEIQWGSTSQSLGDVISAPCEIESLIQTVWSTGNQLLYFDAIVDLDLPGRGTTPALRILNLQSWSAIGKADFSNPVRYYMVLGLGFVGFDWFSGTWLPQTCRSITFGKVSDPLPPWGGIPPS